MHRVDAQFSNSVVHQRRGNVGIFHLLVAMTVLCLCQQMAAAQDNVPQLQTPAGTQPETTLKLSFSKEVKVASVTIGGVNVPVGSLSAGKELYLTVPSSVPLGRQSILVQIAPAANTGATPPATPDPLTGSILVAPLITGLKANKDAALESSRVVIPEGEVIIQFNGKIPPEIRERLKVFLRDTLPEEKKTTGSETTQEIRQWIAEDTYLIVKLPKLSGDFTDIEKKTFAIDVIADGVTLQKETKVRIVYERWMYLGALGLVALLSLIVFVLVRFVYKVPEGQQRFNFVKMLLLEQANQTYSLSRTQFLAWLLVIVFSYLFLFFAHGFIEGDWFFPNIGNAVYAFFISLGTLVISQGTSMVQGPKGAGELHPSLADLVVHGGVLALDRVQQLIWTAIALGMFVYITISTYATASALPEIPMQLIVLMGLSSAGYLGGKMVRGAGPVIDEATSTANTFVNVKGKHLSKNAFVWFDGEQVEKVEVVADDPDDPVKFAKELKLTVPALTVVGWKAVHHTITVINNDAQRADWRTPLEITVTPGAPDPTSNKVTLAIKTARAVKGATVSVPGAPEDKAVQDATDPNVFTAVVDAAWLKEPHDVTLTSGGEKVVHKFKPS